MSREEFIRIMREDGYPEEEINEYLGIADEMRGNKELDDYSPFLPLLKFEEDII